MTDDAWRIQLERSGGFAGVTLKADVDSAKLSEDEAAELERLAGAVDFKACGDPGKGGTGVPDAFQYHLAVEHGSEKHDLLLGESQLDPPLKALVEWLMEQARKRPE